MNRNSVSNAFYSLVILAVFSCISCTHRRDVQLDGGLNADASENSEEAVNADVASMGSDSAIPANEESNKEELAAEVAPAAEPAIENVKKEEELTPSEDTQAANALDTATMETAQVDDSVLGLSDVAPEAPASAPVELAQNDIKVEAPANLLPENSVAYEPAVDAALTPVSPIEEHITATETTEVKPIEKKAKPARKHAPKVKEVSQSVEAKPVAEAPKVEALPERVVASAPVIEEKKAPAPAPVQEKQAPQQAGAGIQGFVEQNLFWIATLIVGFCITVFFVVRRRKDDNYTV